MIYQYRFVAPGNDLHGEPFDIQSNTRAEADIRAASRVRNTFVLSGRTDVRFAFVAEYTSRRAAERAEESGVALADTLPAPAEAVGT